MDARHKAGHDGGGNSTRTGDALTVRLAFIAGFAMAVTSAFMSTPATLAQEQSAPVENSGSEKQDALKQHEKELETAHQAQRQSAEAEAALKREIEQIGSDRRKLNQALIETAEKLRTLENKMTATEIRLKPLDEQAARIHQSLNGRRAVIGEVLAALQRIGHRPPPALISRPEDALQAVRTAMVLGAVLPQMRHEVEILANDLSRLVSVRKKIAAEKYELKTQAGRLESERKRMSALIEERQRQQANREQALQAEQTRAAELARQVDNLKDLITKLEQSSGSATRAAHQADPRLATLNDPSRLAPAVQFASLRGHLPLPVNGVRLKGFGTPDGNGGAEKGLSVGTRKGAQVTAPADGWVVYAGPFRSYGQLLILNVGGGYHILLARMDRISVNLGQFVLTGEPVAVMGNGSPMGSVLTTNSDQPVLYIEFRKDGTPVDPGPWWAAGEGEKARG